MLRTTKGARRHSGKIRVVRHPFVGYLDIPGGTGSELLLAIGRRAGKATVRTRTKRILRDVFRQAQARLPPGAAVLLVAETDLTEIPRKAIRLTGIGLLNRLVTSWQTGLQPDRGPARPSLQSSGSIS